MRVSIRDRPKNSELGYGLIYTAITLIISITMVIINLEEVASQVDDRHFALPKKR